MSKSKLGLVVGLVALAVPLFGATSAQAATTAACAFNGATGGITPDKAAGWASPPGGTAADTGVQNIQRDFNTGSLDDLDTGDYTFATNNTPTGRVACAVDAPGTANDGVFVGHISSVGEYVNRVCGTGTAADDDLLDNPANNVSRPAEITTVDLIDGGPGTPLDIVDAEYSITFEAGTGPLDITVINDSAVPDTGDNPESGAPDGFVNIVPDAANNGGNCVDQDVSRFLASGAFAVSY